MTEPTCSITDSDTDVRYLAGSLSAENAEAFEEHYFGCETCWRAVQRGAEIRSALAQQSTAMQLPRQDLPSSRGQGHWGPALAAAAAIVVAVGLWRVQRPVQTGETGPSENPVNEPTRGSSVPSLISASASDKALTASWPSVNDARTYRVRLLTEDGRLVLDREVPDTAIVLPIDSVIRLEPKGALYWQVEALNDLRVVVSSYALKEARPDH